MGSNGKFKIIIAESMAEDGINLLRSSPNFDVVVLDKSEKEKLVKEIKNADAIVVRSGIKVTEELLKNAENLKIVGRAGVGYDNIDVDACSKRGIVVMIAPSGNTNGVVELTLGMMLDYARHISDANNSMKDGKWEKKMFGGSELKGKTIGIIGLGRIGVGVAKRCQAFEMNVIAFDEYIPKEKAEELGVKLLDNLDELLANSDYITIHTPLTEETRDLIDAKAIKKMKPNAVILNVARGGIVNEKDLADALKEETIGGACIDVYTKEPPTKEDFPFIGLKNCISTPHLGASTEESQALVSKIICENIIEALENGKYIDAVNLTEAKVSQKK